MPSPPGSIELSIWTIYDHPRDCPNEFIARKFIVKNGRATATEDTYSSTELKVLRELFQSQGLYCIPRAPEDDPVILETWL